MEVLPSASSRCGRVLIAHFESQRSWNLAGEYLSIKFSSTVFLERFTGLLLDYVVMVEGGAYDFFVFVCGCRCQRSGAGELTLGRYRDAICEEFVEFGSER